MHTALIEYNLGIIEPMQVYEQLADFEKFAGHHPLMTSVKVIAAAAPRLEYAVEEELKLLGFFSYKPRYKAEVIEEERGKALVYKSNVKWNVYLTIRFTFGRNEQSHLILREDIEVKAMSLIALPFIRLLKSAHNQVFMRMISSFSK